MDGTAETTVKPATEASAPKRRRAARATAGTEWSTEMNSATTDSLCETTTAATQTAESSQAGTAAPHPTARSPSAGESDNEKIPVFYLYVIENSSH